MGFFSRPHIREHRGSASDITGISDDNKIGDNCRALGAAVQPSGFVMSATARPAPAKTKASPDGKGINRKTAAAIKEELKKKFGL